MYMAVPLIKKIFSFWPWRVKRSCTKLTVAQKGSSGNILLSTPLPFFPGKDHASELCAVLPLFLMGGGRKAVMKLISSILSANL